MDFTTSQKVLQDINKNNKETPWKEKKIMNMQAEKGMIAIGEFKRAERMNNCAKYLKFESCKENHYKKLKYASFCTDRMCPGCNQRRSNMLQNQIFKVLHEANLQKALRYLFLTLTIKNVKGEDLIQALDEMFEAIHRLFKYAKIDSICVGFIRNLEITYNAETDEYHPHFHILLAVEKDYFDKTPTNKKYIKQSEWTSLWQKALKADYIPIVNIKAVKQQKNAAFEVGKYSVKDTDYLYKDEQKTAQIMRILAPTLKGRRLIGFGKLCRKIHKELNLQNLESENANLITEDGEIICNCPICQSELITEIYNWDFSLKNYFEN